MLQVNERILRVLRQRMGRLRLDLQASAASSDWHILSLMMNKIRSARRKSSPCGIPLLQGLWKQVRYVQGQTYTVFACTRTVVYIMRSGQCVAGLGLEKAAAMWQHCCLFFFFLTSVDLTAIKTWKCSEKLPEWVNCTGRPMIWNRPPLLKM